MSTIHPPHETALPLRFSIRTLLWLTLVVALMLAGFVQWQKLKTAQRALSRIAWATGDIAIPAGKFRLLVNTVVDDPDLKVCVVRFEANRECYVSTDGQSCLTSPLEDSDLHWAEIKIVANYDATARRFSLLTRVGSDIGHAGGKSVYTLRPQDRPEDVLNVTVKPGLYDLKQAIEISREDGKPVMLTAK